MWVLGMRPSKINKCSQLLNQLSGSLGAALLKEMDPPFPSIYQVLIAPKGVEICANFPLHAEIFVWLELIQILCGFIGACLENSFRVVIHQFGLL